MESIEVGQYKFICFTDVGRQLMISLCESLYKVTAQNIDEPFELDVKSLSDWTKKNFQKGSILVYIGAVGIAVRAIAPYVKDKTTDPGVVVIDEQGRFVIPILSGHIGGAVDAAKMLSEIIGATAVVTTATDGRGEFSVDVFAKKNDLSINNMVKAKEFTASLLKTGKETYSIDSRFSSELYVAGIPENIEYIADDKEEGFCISARDREDILCLIPKCIVAGVGCRKGKSYEELNDFLLEVLRNENIDIRALKALCSIDLKKDEAGIKDLSEALQITFETFSSDELMEQEGDFSSSSFALEVTGADNICERSVMAYGCKRIILKKTTKNGMTIALGIMDTIMEN
ncbi:cobalt-precorrin 5A hydrolase [Butyrivibrio sp. VCD2006]|uniref:cobalt-precorrin 5A hydrolase n=1 Tax=Butyrivibrio sp. VCD2006 TaxID=1280664 RepID=UPI000412A627|nr:cobalamin biosynthesis protein [Butyrivibrio sp. VCD2006]